jgi:hypothetical protein
MFQKKSQGSLFPIAIVAALAATVTVVVATLLEAVAGMQTFL